MVDLSSIVILLVLAMVGFPRRFSVSGHRCEVNSLFVVVALFVSRGLGFFRLRVVQQNQINPYECGSSHSRGVARASYIQLAKV
jgi:hypothetical protein